jgi:serine/threonine protein kinase
VRFLAPGARLGKYDLIRQIAVGGMAELYLARTTGIEGFEKLVVVKRILPQYVANPSFVTMFLNEARLAATLQHPNIAQVYDIGVDEGDYFFSMEYIHGEDLGRTVTTATEQGVPMSLDASLTLVAGLCAGLHYAHEKAGPDGKPLGVVHRDVSPSNVLVSYDGAIKLVDFGIARATSQPVTTHSGLKGKITYMSPEQCRGNVALDRRSDLFSVGTILYELTTGSPPFTGETEYGVLNQIVTADVPPPTKLVPSYPAALETIVLKALARDVDQRYATALELQTALEDFAHEQRLRVSPLVLARLMGTLFPQRLEEWDHARAQGAFFVEQHVVRTLIESGKAGEATVSGEVPTTASAPVVDEDSTTAVGPVPIQPGGEDSVVAPPPVARTPTPIPAPPVVPVHRPSTPPSAWTAPRVMTPIPGGVPIVSVPAGGVMVTPPHGGVVEAAHKVGDVTEQVRVPPSRSGTVLARRSRAPAIIITASCVTALGIAAFLVFGGSSSTVGSSPTPAAENPRPVEPPPTPTAAPAPVEPPTATVDPPPVEDKAPPPVEDKAPIVEDKAPPAKVVTKPHKAVTHPTKSRPAKVVKADAGKKAEPKPEPPPEPEAKAWNADSPFMPVKTEKK